MTIHWHELGIITSDNLTDDTKLYRYVNLSHFISFVETKKTYLTNINNWEDTWEIPKNKIPTEINGKIESPLWSIFDDMFGQCWSLEGSSDALWRIYSQHKEGLLLQTSVKKIKLMESNIKFGMLAPVIYYDNLMETFNQIEKIKGPKSVFKDAFLKRNAFKHEKEVRLVTLNDERCLEKKIKNCTHLEIELNPIEFLEGITIDPRASDWYVDSIKKYCKRAGFSIIPKKSNLYSDVYEETQMIMRFVPKK